MQKGGYWIEKALETGGGGGEKGRGKDRQKREREGSEKRDQGKRDSGKVRRCWTPTPGY